METTMWCRCRVEVDAVPLNRIISEKQPLRESA